MVLVLALTLIVPEGKSMEIYWTLLHYTWRMRKFVEVEGGGELRNIGSRGDIIIRANFHGPLEPRVPAGHQDRHNIICPC